MKSLKNYPSIIMYDKYPKHFYEKIRIEIAVMQIQHDLRKLLPTVSHSEWNNIDKDILEWFFGEKFELEPVHDFWNFFGGFARGLKQKSLLSWITAENVCWEKKFVPVDQIIITWDFPGLDFMQKAPYPASLVIEELRVRPKAKNTLFEDSEERSKKYSPRDHFPIVLFYDPKGGVIDKYTGYYVLEGNRRAVRAIVYGKKSILAYVAKFKRPQDFWPINYWFSTGILRDLVFIAIGLEKKGDQIGFKIIRLIYQLLLRDFEIARIATIDRTFKNYETSKKLLYEIFNKDMKW